MSLMAKDKGGEGFPPIDPGTHHAVCYGVVDMGTQQNPLFDSKVQKVWIAWELPDVRIEFDRDGKHYNLPRSISKIYTLSIHEKSNLGKDLVSWRGVAFTEEEKQGFDIFNVLEANCLLQIVHQQKNGKTYGQISTIAKLMKNMQKLKPESPVIKYSMDTDGFEIPKTVPEWVEKMIKKSEEYQGGRGNNNNPDVENYPPATDDESDQIPF